MKFIQDARQILLKAWSVRLALISALLSAAEVALPYFTDLIPQHTMAVLATAVAFGAAVARVIAQPAMHGDQA